jgi:hypothetical protein
VQTDRHRLNRMSSETAETAMCSAPLQGTGSARLCPHMKHDTRPAIKQSQPHLCLSVTSTGPLAPCRGRELQKPASPPWTGSRAGSQLLPLTLIPLQHLPHHLLLPLLQLLLLLWRWSSQHPLLRWECS